MLALLVLVRSLLSPLPLNVLLLLHFKHTAFLLNFNLFNLIALARTLARMLALLALVLTLALACVTSS